MEYLSSSIAAEKTGLTSRRIQQMCKEGKIPGAVKKGKEWLIPDSGTIAGETRPLPVGVSDFKKASSNYYYVDKTLMIRDFLDSKPGVSLYTRPRRFGKTMNMNMLRTFFEKTEEDTSIYFKDKKIWKCGEAYREHQGKYPVIFLTFKDVKCPSWKETFQKIRSLLSSEFIRHSVLETSDKLTDYEKDKYRHIAGETADEVETEAALELLSRLLDKHYGRECIIIIDEYDTPIQEGHNSGFYPRVINFMRNFFSGGLKDNPHLAFGFLTGILRIAKESIFSGMNNLKIYSILDEAYSSYFGFTENEVFEMLKYYRREEKYDEVCRWYDGYKFGSTEIFNPWSLINYISDKCVPRAFWLSTGSNDIIGEIISSSYDEIKEGLCKLLTGEKITTFVDTDIIYPEIKNNPYSVYSFLVVAGYLKIDKTYPQNDGNLICDIAIPNKEIAFVYEKEILQRTNQVSTAISIAEAVFSGDEKRLESLLEDFMVRSISFMDGGSESFYHGMMIGLCAVLGDRYRIMSNRESGLGRFDIALFPQIKGIPGFIFEFKYTNDLNVDLDQLAGSALSQIKREKYDTELRISGVKTIIRIGIAFRGKNAVVKKALQADLLTI